jgi:hypothetical protein
MGASPGMMIGAPGRVSPAGTTGNVLARVHVTPAVLWALRPRACHPRAHSYAGENSQDSTVFCEQRWKFLHAECGTRNEDLRKADRGS